MTGPGRREPGSRSTRPRPSTPGPELAWWRRPSATFGSVVVLIAAVVLLTTAVAAPLPASPAALAVRAVPVQDATLVCPAPGGRGGSTTTDVSALSASGVSGAGSLTIAGLAAPTHPLVRSTGAVRAAGVERIVPSGPLVVDGQGADAPGLAAAQVTATPAGSGRGVAGTACVAPGVGFWFVGSGSSVGQRSRLYLTNPSTAAAQVDVTLYGAKGPISTPSTQSLVVGPRTQRVLALDALAPGVGRLAVHVVVSVGTIAAALYDTQVAGLVPRGIDWVPAAVSPGRTVVVPGVPGGGDGPRLLQILVPGAVSADVHVWLVSASSTVTPLGLQSLVVPAGSLGQVDLARFTHGANVSVLLTSSVPVTAGVLSRRASQTSADTEIAYSAAVAPLSGPTPVPGIADSSTTRTELLLGATGAGARVRVTPVAPAGTRGLSLAPVVVSVPSRTTVTVEIDRFVTGARTGGWTAPGFGLVVTPLPGSGPVYATRQVTMTNAAGPMVTVVPLVTPVTTVSEPQVRRVLDSGPGLHD